MEDDKTLVVGEEEWRPLRAGDTAYWIRTDHPEYSKACHEGDYACFRDSGVAEYIAAAWNSYRPVGDEYPFYVKEVVLLPKRANEPDMAETGQLQLFDPYPRK